MVLALTVSLIVACVSVVLMAFAFLLNKMNKT